MFSKTIFFFSENPRFEFLQNLPLCDRLPLGNHSFKRKRNDEGSIGDDLPPGFNIQFKVQRFLEGSDVSELVKFPPRFIVNLVNQVLNSLPDSDVINTEDDVTIENEEAEEIEEGNEIEDENHDAGALLSNEDFQDVNAVETEISTELVEDIDATETIDHDDSNDETNVADENVGIVDTTETITNSSEDSIVMETIVDANVANDINDESAENDNLNEFEGNIDVIEETTAMETTIYLAVQDEAVQEIGESPVVDEPEVLAELPNAIVTLGDGDDGGAESEKSIEVVTLEDSVGEDDKEVIDIDNLVGYFEAGIKNDYKDVIIESGADDGALPPSDVSVEVISIEGEARDTTVKEDDEIVILSSSLNLNQVPSTPQAPIIPPSSPVPSSSIPSSPSQYLPSLPSAVDIGSPNTSSSSLASVSELLESSTESIDEASESLTRQFLFNFNPKYIKKVANSISVGARLEIQLESGDPPISSHIHPDSSEREGDTNSAVDDGTPSVSDEGTSAIDEDEDEVEECDSLYFPLEPFPCGSEDDLEDEIELLPSQDPVEGNFVAPVRRVYIRMKLITLSGSFPCLAQLLPNEWVFNRELSAFFNEFLLCDSHYTHAGIELRSRQIGWWYLFSDDSPEFEMFNDEVDFHISQLRDFDGRKLKEIDVEMFYKLKSIKREQLVTMSAAVSVQNNVIEPGALFNPPEGQVPLFVQTLPSILTKRFRRLFPVQIFEPHQNFLVIFQLQQYSVHLRYHMEYLNLFIMKYGYIREFMAGISKLRIMVRNSFLFLEVVDQLISSLNSLSCDECKIVGDCTRVKELSCYKYHDEIRRCVSSQMRIIHRLLPTFSKEDFSNDISAIFLYDEKLPPKTRSLYKIVREVARYVATRN